DDESTWPQAQSTLASLDWRQKSLRDPGGTFFYQARTSGLLPYAILLTPQGDLIQTFEKLDEPTVHTLETLIMISLAPDAKKNWEFRDQARYRYLKTTPSTRNEATTQLARIQYNSKSWEISAEHRILGQKTEPIHHELWEDEIGRFAAQWRDQKNTATM